MANVQAPLWRTLQQASQPMSVPELRDAIAASRSSIQLRLIWWERAGLVQREGEGHPRYLLTDKGRAAANDDNREPPKVRSDGSILPRQRSQRARLWSAMRVLKRFNLPELIIASGCTRRSAEEIINVLHRAGYLRQLSRGNPMQGSWSVYLLAANSGPKPPVISTYGGKKTLTDPNNGKVVDVTQVSLRKPKHAAAAGGKG